MKISVIVFPGTNCDHDTMFACKKLAGFEAQEIWHRDTDLGKPDAVIVPGGFAHGDYLRTGALAKISPIMKEVVSFASKGGPVLGICNGFQVLCEVGLLPGALLQNISMKFLSQFIHMKVERNDTPFTRDFEVGEIVTCPMAHFEGNYFAEPETLTELEAEGRVILRYCGPNGEIDHQNREYNPNGSALSIAGVCNSNRNVAGFMPHPERSADQLVNYIGSTNELNFFTSLAK